MRQRRTYKETIITFSTDLMDEGKFSIGTSVDKHWRRLIAIVGQETLTNVRENRDDKGKVTWRSADVPLEHFSPTNLGLRRGKRKANPAAIKALAEFRANKKES